MSTIMSIQRIFYNQDFTYSLYPTRAPPPFIPKSLLHSPTSPHQEFTLFPLLPLELRLRIYRFCFPSHSRPVRLDLGITRSPSPRYPTTLLISHESRQETLRHYAVIHATSRFDFEGRITPAFIFNPKVDVLFVSTQILRTKLKGNNLAIWIDYLDEQLTAQKMGGLASVRQLKLLGFPDQGSRNGLRIEEVDESENENENVDALFAATLLRMRGLRTVTVEVSENGKQNARTALEGFFAHYRERFDGGVEVVCVTE